MHRVGFETLFNFLAIRIYYETMKSMMNDMYNPLLKLNPFNGHFVAMEEPDLLVEDVRKFESAINTNNRTRILLSTY